MKKYKRVAGADRKRRGARLGQHFLTRSSVAGFVADAVHVSPREDVLEIGPGKGILTRALLARGARVTAIEKDPELVQFLKNEFKDALKEKKLHLIEGDARDFLSSLNAKRFPLNARYKLVANIPYYITGELLRLALTAEHQPIAIAFLVQKEVAERVARDTKESILSLSIKVYGTPRYVKTVPKGSFNPPPSVDSAILAITNISRKNFISVSEKIFFSVVKAGFAQKRKTLGGNLKKVFGERGTLAVRSAKLPEKIRAEDVTLQEWLTLAQRVQGPNLNNQD